MQRSVFCVLALLGLLAACDKTAPPASAPAPFVLSAGDVLTATVRPVIDSLPFTGTLNPLVSSGVGTELEGKVLEVRVQEGQRVKKGEVLARIDDQNAVEAVSEQVAQLENSQSRLELARIKLEKQRQLLQQGFISKLAFDELASDFAVNAGEFKVQQSQLARARKTLADSVLHAPIDGVVYQRKINPGEQATRNASLFSIADLSVLEITATIPSQLVARVQLDQKAQFQAEGDKQAYRARVARINPVALSGTRSFAVYLQVDNRAGQLRAGQFVQGGIALRQIDDAVALPLAALRDVDGQPWVMTVEQGRLARRAVKILLRSDAQQQAAVSGVAPGQSILVGSLLGLAAGDAVSMPGGA